MDMVEVSDLYEAAYLLLNKCSFLGVECVILAGILGCRYQFEVDDTLVRCQESFRNREATANLFKFRTAYNTINGYMHQAKKSYDQARRREKRAERDAVDFDGNGVDAERYPS